MRRNRHRLALLAATAAIVLALAGAAVASAVSRGGADAATVTAIKVTEREYKITLSKTTAAAGTVTFTVHNVGHTKHALAVSGGGLSGVKKTLTIAPGKTRTLTVKFTTGGVVQLWCPMPGHAALGMKTSLKLTGAAPAPVGGSSTTGDTSTGGGYVWG
jgi:iron uptake system component EfeO